MSEENDIENQEDQVCYTLLVVDESGDILMPSDVDGEIKLLPCPLILSKADFEEADVKTPEDLDQLLDDMVSEFEESDEEDSETEDDSEEEDEEEKSEEEDESEE